jgi:hypothetical protein
VHADHVERIVVTEAVLGLDGKQLATPARTPMAIGAMPDTYPAAGVMPTRPATMPEAAPRLVKWPSRTRSTIVLGTGILCGAEFSRGQLARRPSTRATASAAIPALTWIAVPPAKSSEPRW